jgi:hypothetical protein
MDPRFDSRPLIPRAPQPILPNPRVGGLCRAIRQGACADRFCGRARFSALRELTHRACPNEAALGRAVSCAMRPQNRAAQV